MEWLFGKKNRAPKTPKTDTASEIEAAWREHENRPNPRGLTDEEEMVEMERQLSDLLAEQDAEPTYERPITFNSYEQAEQTFADSLKHPHVIGIVKRGHEASKFIGKEVEAAAKAKDTALKLFRDAGPNSDHRVQDGAVILAEYDLVSDEDARNAAKKAITKMLLNYDGNEHMHIHYALLAIKSCGLESDEDIRDVAKESVLSNLRNDDVNKYHHLKNALELMKGMALSADEFDSSELRRLARDKFEIFTKNSFTGWGTAVLVKDLIAFIGQELRDDPQIRAQVLEQIAEMALRIDVKSLGKEHSDLADINTLIKTFVFTSEETASFMTPELADALKNEQWTSEGVLEARAEWARRMDDEGKSPGYDVEFDPSRDLSKHRPR